MTNNQAMIIKLQSALNAMGDKILYRTSQFYSEQAKRPVSIYYIDRAYLDEESGKTKKNELFHTTSQLQVILFLNDLLKINRGEPLPTDNEIWNRKRKEIDYYSTLENVKYEGEK